MSNHKRMNRVAGVQRLENRQMMAGDVSVTTTSGDDFDLNINGDAQSNQISIIGNGQSLIVRGHNTTINGNPLVNGISEQVIPLTRGFKTVQSLEDVNVNMNGGHDTVTVEGIFAQWDDFDLDIDLGSGNDRAQFWGAGGIDELTIDGGSGSGADSINLWSVSARDIEIDTGRGNDYVGGFQVVATDKIDIEPERVRIRSACIGSTPTNWTSTSAPTTTRCG